MKALKLLIRIPTFFGSLFAVLLIVAIWLFSILTRIITGIAHKIR